jgi:hypothetical protein
MYHHLIQLLSVFWQVNLATALTSTQLYLDYGTINWYRNSETAYGSEFPLAFFMSLNSLPVGVEIHGPPGSCPFDDLSFLPCPMAFLFKTSYRCRLKRE